MPEVFLIEGVLLDEKSSERLSLKKIGKNLEERRKENTQNI